jgi:subtilisin family serine protease
MSKKFANSKVIALVSATALLFGALSTGIAANAAKPVVAGKPADVGNAASGKPADTGKPADAGKPIDVVGKPIEIGKPADTGKDYIDVKTDGSTGKPATKEGKATFGNVEKLTAAERKAAAKAKAQAKKDNGNKVNYIVRFNEAADFGLEMAALKSGKATIGREFQHVFKGALVGLTDKQKVNLAKRPSVASITEDLEVTATEIQASPASWGIDRIDQGALPLSGSYNYGGSGTGVSIYVVDTGIRSTHTEFSGRIQTGFSAIADGKGTEDCNGHGTHVSSTAAGNRFGVAKSASLVPVRVLGCDGSGTTSGVIAGLDWIASQYVAGSPAVVNMSLGGGANSSLDTAVSSLINRGVTVVAAAGNSSTDSCTSSPARVAGAITVAASTNTDVFASYSNFGSCVDLIAPGSNIVGAWITGDSDSATLSGTSMATPHVAGVSAVLLGSGYVAPNLVALALTDAATVGAVGSVPGGTVNKLLYANPAGITVPATKAPLAPTSVSAVAGKRAATVNWVQADNTGAAVVSQTVQVWSGGNIVGSAKVSATATSALLKLRAGVSYSFTVVATNSIATSLQSPMSNLVIPTNK